MNKAYAKFMHWFGDNYELVTMFNLPNGSTVSIHQVEQKNIEHDDPPDYLLWKKEIELGRRCEQCWGHHPRSLHNDGV